MLGAQASGRHIGSGVVLAFPLAMAIFAWVPAEFAVVAGASILYGATNGIMTIVRGIFISEMVSKEVCGAENGAMAGPMTVARAGVPLAAAAWSVTGSTPRQCSWRSRSGGRRGREFRAATSACHGSGHVPGKTTDLA